ncbi:MAG TPA: FkbM family methyltransferase [Terriglobales bacterium]|nr:FkbM family methyltransferase [Terriglobales bacterium]
MTNFSVLRYRMYFAAKDLGVPDMLRRWPWAVRALRRFKALIERYALPNKQVWVQAQAGLSQGMWMRLRLPEEARHWRGEHETEVQDAICAGVRPGTVVYDIGSHVGTVALGVARLVGQLGRVVAFDGDPDNTATLGESRLRNRLEARLAVVHAAVWSYTASHGIPFRRGGTRRSQGGVEANGQHPVAGTGEIISVPAVTLDDFIAAGGPVPQLVKIDVEGGEYEVLRGGTNLFASQRPLIIAEVHHQQAAELIGVWLGQYQYCAQWNIPRENFPRCMFAWPTEYDGATWMQKSAGFRKPRPTPHFVL